MKVDFLSQAGKLLKEQKRFRRQMIVFFCLAVVVLYGTVTALMLYGQAMTHKAEVLDCCYKVHEHTDKCYEMGEDGTLGTEPVCGYADYVIHVHNDGCYNADGTLACTLEEHEPHEHTDECYRTERVLICGMEEGSTAESAKGAVGSQKELADTETPKGEAPEPVAKEETPEPAAEEESSEPEAREEEPEPEVKEEVPAPESEEHTDEESSPDTEPAGGHEESDEPKEDAAEETSDDGAEEAAAPAGGAEDGDAAEGGHVHTDACYEERTVLVCGEQELHTHEAGCYAEECFDEDGSLKEGSRPICGLLQLEEHMHTADCFRTVELTPEEVAALNNGAKLHVHKDDCYDADGNLICGYDETHIHGLDCYDEEGNLICGYEAPKNAENSKTYESENYTVVVTYNDDAKIPEDAELVVEEITSDSDKEHYEGRETEYREMLEDAEAAMQALLRIGFCQDGKEIEPKTPVSVSVQFTGEDGQTEGKPMKIVRFAEEGTEKINGSYAKDNSTTFKLDRFSEIAIGYGGTAPEGSGDGALYILDSFEHDTVPFHITFQVEGEAKAAGEPSAEDRTDTDGQTEATSGTSEEEPGEDAAQSGHSDNREEPADTDTAGEL